MVVDGKFSDLFRIASADTPAVPAALDALVAKARAERARS